MAHSSKLIWYKCLMGAILVGFVKGKTCWVCTWYNSSAPSDHGGSDSESQPIGVLNTICADGRTVIDAHCRDDRGELFRGFKNDTASKYVANCTVETGLICHPYADGMCADFAIQYGCACPTPLPQHITARGTTNAWKGITSDRGTTANKGTTTNGNIYDANVCKFEENGRNGRTAFISNPILVIILITVALVI